MVGMWKLKQLCSLVSLVIGLERQKKGVVPAKRL